MMRDRLRQVKSLLRPDGSIWAHLDDSEVHRMRCVLDEVFGAANFVGSVLWQKADSTRNDGGMSAVHDTILVYGSSDAFETNRICRTEEDNARFTNPDDDPRGPWWDGDPTANHGDGGGGMCYAVQSPITGEMLRPAKGRNWVTSQRTLLAAMNQWAPYRLENLHDEAYRAENEGIPLAKTKRDVCALVLDVPLEEAQMLVEARREAGNWPEYIVRTSGGLGRKAYIPSSGKVPHTWWSNDEVGHNREAKAEIKALFPGVKPFDTPKPERLIERVIQIGSDPGDIVLDFYAGSGTTAAVAHKMGRRWVTCELSADSISRYVIPRLQRVLAGADKGGVTFTTKRVAVAPLPDKVTLKDAQSFNTTLGRVVEGGLGVEVALGKTLAKAVRAAGKAGTSPLSEAEQKSLLSLLRKIETAPELVTHDVTKDAKSALAGATKTRAEVTKNWHGGGGFTYLEVGPSMFELIDGVAYLADWARNGQLARAVAAQTRFPFDAGRYPFVGRRGRRLLCVWEGNATVAVVEHVVEHLEYGESVVIYAVQVDPAARSVLPRGSKLERIPDALIEAYARGAGRSVSRDWTMEGQHNG